MTRSRRFTISSHSRPAGFACTRACARQVFSQRRAVSTLALPLGAGDRGALKPDLGLLGKGIMVTNARRLADVESFLAALNPTGRLGSEEGLLYGSPDARLSGILVSWMATVETIRHAAAAGCNLIISHETLTFFDYFPQAASGARTPWVVDVTRLALLRDSGISVLRAHSTVDPTHVVPEFVRAIGLCEAARQGDVWSFHECAPIAVREMAGKAKQGLGMEYLRVTGDPDRQVARIGTMVGGLGLDRHIDAWVRDLLPLGVELIVAGETNDFAQRFALDAGIALIETCHSASEDPGLRRLARDLQREFGDVPVVFHPQPVPWRTL